MRAADPPVSQVSGVVYMPQVDHGPWGIYDRSGTIVPATVDLHGPNGEAHGQPDLIDLPTLDGIPMAQDRYYIYGGALNAHYGHFILNTLPRLWQRSRLIDHGAKILFHGRGTATDWFARPFIREIFSSLLIKPEHIVTFSAPTMIKDLIVPHTSLQEQKYVHRIFGNLGAKIGRTLAGSEPLQPNSDVIYFSKTALKSGVGRVVNESIIEDILEENGVKIVHPETLTMREQVRLFAQSACILGIVGSAFHTGLFYPPRGRVICVSPNPGPNSNFYLLDGAAGYTVNYYFPPGSRVVAKNSDGFITSMEVARPDLIAADLLALI